MSKKQQQKLNLIEWCDQQVAEGKELKILWDGGGDSGWIHMELDGTDVSGEYAETLENHIDTELDYGSWAGEFSANGEAIYDTDKKAFVGEDYYSETESFDYEVNIPIYVPKDLWFNNMRIHIEAQEGDETSVDVDLIINNGFRTPAHIELEQEIKESIEQQVNKAVDRFINGGHDYESIWDDFTFTYTDNDREEGDMRVYVIDKLDIRHRHVEDKPVYLDLKQIN